MGILYFQFCCEPKIALKIVYYSESKKKVLLHATTWMKLKNMILSERSQSRKTIVHNSIYMKYPEQRKSIKTENRLVIP